MRSFLRAPGRRTAQGALEFSKLRHPTCQVLSALQGHREHREPLAHREPQELQALAAYRASPAYRAYQAFPFPAVRALACVCRAG